MGKENKSTKDKKETNEKLEDVIEASANSSLVNQSKRQKKKVIIISLIIVILLAIGGITFYILNNPRFIFKSAVNNMFNGLETNMENLNDININSSDLNNDFIATFNDLEINENNIMPIINGIQKSTLEIVDGEKVTSNDMTIKVNGKDVKTNRVSLEINKKNNDKFITNLKKDNEFLTACKKLSGYTKSQIKTLLALSDNTFNTPLTISIYTSGMSREFVKLEISKEINNTTNVINLIKISDNEYEYRIVNNSENLTGDIMIQDKDIIINYYKYENDIIVNSGTIMIQREYK